MQDEKHKILYILGAGASANAIPPVQGLNSAIVRWGNVMEQYGRVLELREAHSINRLSRLFLRFGEEASKSYSVDTLARKYYLRKDDETLGKLKTVIALTIQLESLNSNTDLRYEAFLASLIDEKTLALPETIRIFSWNYDLQLTEAYLQILNKFIADKDKLYYEEVDKHTRLTRLNGSIYNDSTFSSSFDDIDDIEPNLRLKLNKPSQLVHGLVSFLEDRKSRWYNLNNIGSIKFAWEEERSFLELAAFRPTIIVVIGYSFPTYNRDVDKNILNTLERTTESKVYVQCNFRDANGKLVRNYEGVKSNLQGLGIDAYKIEEVEESNEFRIPFEFNKPLDPLAVIYV